VLRCNPKIRKHEVLAEPKYGVKSQGKPGMDEKKSNAEDPRTVQEDIVLHIV